MKKFKKLPKQVLTSSTTVGDDILENKNPKELKWYYYTKVDRSQYPSFYGWIKALRIFDLPRGEVEGAVELKRREKPAWSNPNEWKDPIGAPALPMNYYKIVYIDYYGAKQTADFERGWDEAEAVDNLDISLKHDDSRNGVAEVITIEQVDDDESMWKRQLAEEDEEWRNTINTYREEQHAPNDADYDYDLGMFTHPEDPDLLWNPETNEYDLRWDYNKGIIPVENR